MFGIDTALISALFGTLSGILGHWFKAKEEREKREFELRKINIEMERDKLNSELRIKEIEANLHVTEVVAESNLLIEETKGWNSAILKLNENIIGSDVVMSLLSGRWMARAVGLLVVLLFAMVDVARASIRPAITAGAFYAVYVIAYNIADNFVFVDKQTLLKSLIDALIYVLTAATQFWFMDRQGARDYRKKH